MAAEEGHRLIHARPEFPLRHVALVALDEVEHLGVEVAARDAAPDGVREPLAVGAVELVAASAPADHLLVELLQQQAGGDSSVGLPDYSRSVDLYRRLLRDYPGYRNNDGTHYLLGYCLGEMGQDAESRQAFLGLVCHNKYAALDPPPEMIQLLGALRASPADTDRFIGALIGTVGIPEFFAPANVGRIIAAATDTPAQASAAS